MTKAFTVVFQLAVSTFRRKWGPLLAFALGVASFHYIVAASYPAIGGATAVESVVRTFPPGLRRLLKLAPNLQAGFGLHDYLALGFFHPVFLGLGSAFVVGRATDALAGAVEQGSIYLLLSRPIPRSALVVGRALDLIVGAGVIAFAAWFGMVVAVLTTTLPEPVPLVRYLVVASLAWALFAALGVGALVISSWGNRTGRVVGLATAWTLVSFVLDVVPAIGESRVAWINPWHHYDPQAVVATGNISLSGLLVLMAWTVAGTATAAAIFTHRDLA